jgi:ATP phosphoribosyltransferase regulatory subunit
VAGHAVTIGRGGSYSVTHADGRSDPAVGFSLYPDPLIGAGLGREDSERRLFLPLGHDPAAAAALRADGWVTVAALSDTDRPAGCSMQLGPNGPEPI